MVFSSILFLFIYLPAVLAVYYLIPARYRNLWLFIVNLAFYGWGEPVYILLMIFSICLNYVSGRLIDRNRENRKKARAVLTVNTVLNLALLFFFKYFDLVARTLSMIPGVNIPTLGLTLPIGISFYTFQTMSYPIDVYRGDGRVQKNFIKFGTFVALFPQLIAGPIVRYKTIADQIVNRVVCRSDYRLVVTDEAGQMYVRRAETNAGDLVADAYRQAMGADIAFENGGGIRNDVQPGDITYGHIAALSPYDQALVMLEVTGATILDLLRKCTAKTPDFDGNFPQCSGISYTIHTASHTVSDVRVLDKATGQYADIDPARSYTVAVTTYYKGGGFYDALKGCKVLKQGSELTRDVVANFMEKSLQGRTGATYAKPQGRITIVD